VKERGPRGGGGGNGPRPSDGPRRPDGFVQKGNARYDRHDTYYRQAKKEGYVARSIYKLDEIDAKFHLLRAGDFVLDLGCAPGSWLQYAADKVGHKGHVVGIDLLPAKIALGPHVRILQGDAFDTSIEELTGDVKRRFDVVLSDMAPNTTGIKAVDQARSLALCEHALEVAKTALKDGGGFCVKIFEGGEQKAFINACREVFASVDVYRPKSTRVGSIETYVVGRKKKAFAQKTSKKDA
jgi:23S rRNA (uridine2552-2'-O)-methyltransferase